MYLYINEIDLLESRLRVSVASLTLCTLIMRLVFIIGEIVAY